MLDQTPLHLDREGIKEGEGSERGCEAIIIFEGGNYFKYFRLEGGGGRQLFEGDDESRDGYFSRKYGTSTCINIK